MRWSRADTVLTLALAIVVACAFFLYLPRFRAAGGAPTFYQAEFAPAVMLTCGRGFVQVDADRVPALSAFLRQQRDAIRCDDIPASITGVPPNALQATTAYLMALFSFVWSLTGISWRASDFVISTFAASAVAGAYAALRTLCNRWWSLAATLFWAVSPRHVDNVPHLRDYSKTPFFMALLVVIGLLLNDRRPRHLLAIAAVFGVAQGIGFGMRTDMVLNFAPFLLVLFAIPLETGGRTMKVKLAAAATSLIVFGVVSLPIIRAYASNSSLSHVALLGLTSPYDEKLNLGFPRTAYRFPDVYVDRYIQTVVQAYAVRVHGADALPTMTTRAYDDVCREYFLRLVRMFPGDFATRATASALLVANLPFHTDPGREVPQGVGRTSAAATLWRWRAALVRPFDGIGIWVIAASVLVVGAVNLRYAVVASLVFWFWAAMPALEFDERHTFHLEFAVLAAAVAAAALVAASWPSGRPHWTAQPALKSAAFVAAVAAAVAAAIVIGRTIQRPRAAALIEAYAHAPTVEVVPAPQMIDADTTRLGVDLFGPATRREDVQEALVRADFDFAGCGRPTMVNAAVRYAQSDRRFAEDFSETLALGYLGPTTTTVFMPVYAVAHDWAVTSRFAGFEVPASFASCVRLRRVIDPGRLGLVIPMTVAPDWPRKLYARLRLGQALGY